MLQTACHSHACTSLGASFHKPSVRGGRMTRRCSVVPRAQAEERPSIPAPKGVTQPPYQPSVPPATFGFVDNAERLNSRAAMIGFFALLAVEAIANKGLLEMLGFTVGQGLGFEL